MIIDTHAHFNDHAFDTDRDELLQKMHEGGIWRIINSGCSVQSTLDSIAMAEKYHFVYTTAGIHPEHAHETPLSDFDEIARLAQHEKVCAIGEIGLDYYYSKDYKKEQKEAFVNLIDIAYDLKKPFVIHTRDACGDTLEILKNHHRGGDFVCHCFSESVETAKILLKMGAYMSIGGTVTFKNNVRTVEAVKYIPLDRLMLETDSPYLAPTPHRGERNCSLFLHYVAEKIAEIKGISYEEVVSATSDNAKKIFNI